MSVPNDVQALTTKGPCSLWLVLPVLLVIVSLAIKRFCAKVDFIDKDRCDFS